MESDRADLERERERKHGISNCAACFHLVHYCNV